MRLRSYATTKGTTRIIYQSDAAPLSYYFLPFGRQEAPSPTGSDNESVTLRYTNHERDTGIETDVLDDLDYMRARYCSPIEGRFLNPDPVPRIGISQARPQLFNRYSYTGNNPVSFVDPSGEFIQTACTPDGPCKELNLIKHTLNVAGASDLAALLTIGVGGRVEVGFGRNRYDRGSTAYKILDILTDRSQVNLKLVSDADVGPQLRASGGALTTASTRVPEIYINLRLATSARFEMEVLWLFRVHGG